jgi:hypothetical protein
MLLAETAMIRQWAMVFLAGRAMVPHLPQPSESPVMQQVKLFKAIESEVPALEEQINVWLKKSGAKVISMTGNIAPQSPQTGDKQSSLSSSPFAASDILVIVLYEAS